jgi:hypothetical protein
MSKTAAATRRSRRTAITVLLAICAFLVVSWFEVGLDGRRQAVSMLLFLGGLYLLLWSLEAREALKLIANEEATDRFESCEASKEILAWVRANGREWVVKALESGDSSTAEYRGALLYAQRMIAWRGLRLG